MQNTDNKTKPKAKRKHRRETKLPKVTMSNFVKEIAESCMYQTYEVEDVMRHFSIVLQRLLLEGNEVKIDGIGTIRLHLCKPKLVKLNNEVAEYYPWYNLTIRKDTWFRDEIKYSNINKEEDDRCSI